MLRNDKTGYMPTLDTKRLRLRKLTMHDAADIYAYCKDPLVAQHVLWDAQRSIGEARAYLRFMLRKYRNLDAASWGIEWKETGQIIGTIGYMYISRESDTAEVGYSLSRAFWGKGIMTEALLSVIAYGFDFLDLNRIEAMHELDNPASGAVMRKCGMTYEGTLRDKLYNKGRYVDVAMYSILAEEYYDLKG